MNECNEYNGDNTHKDALPIEICDDIAIVGECGEEWSQEMYIDENGQKRIGMTRI